MPGKKTKQINTLGTTPHIWLRHFEENRMPQNGTVIEVAPGYEPKIGEALAMYGFTGTIYLVDQDGKAAKHVQRIYRRILPRAKVKVVAKLLQNLRATSDVPLGADAVVASHPFDDMVMAAIVRRRSFFSEEQEGGEETSPRIKKIYAELSEKDYSRGVRMTVAAWKRLLQKLQPKYFIASQYPSRILTVKGLTRRQNSGYAALDELKDFYEDFLAERRDFRSLGFKGDPRWWIVAADPAGPRFDLSEEPHAIQRLGKTIFVPQMARRLRPGEYDIVYVDRKYFKNFTAGGSRKLVQKLAVTLCDERERSARTVITYADRQRDKTDISLSGNLGSGRAVYYGNRFNILGVGKTTLCKSEKPSHSTGKLEIIGAMRRVILSNWINYFTDRAPAHPALIVLKNTTRVKWNAKPINLGLLVRADDGSLDRPTHVEQSPKIPVNFKKTLIEYAKLDAEYFAYRILCGAWSAGNFSLNGRLIDLESVSFVKYRGPYYTSSSKYPHNRFGYEALGFIEILRRLAHVKNVHNKNIPKRFYEERRKHLGCCFLSLLGVDGALASKFFSMYEDRVMSLSDKFEKLSKKVSNATPDLNCYAPISEEDDPSLLDMSNLFRNLAELYGRKDAEKKAMNHIIRRAAFSRIRSGRTLTAANAWERFAGRGMVVTSAERAGLMRETTKFIHELFRLIAMLDAEKCLGARGEWNRSLRFMNQNLPPMSVLNAKLRALAESYRRGSISPATLGREIKKLCVLPSRLNPRYKSLSKI